MARTDDFRDYLYVSARKVVRMSRTLPVGRLTRLRGAQVNLGPVGAGVTLDQDSRAEDVISLVPAVERAIERHHGIHSVTDPDLQVGQWFRISGVRMAYGVPGDTGGVLFLGHPDEERGTGFFLGGSSQYLLDRPVVEPDTDWERSTYHGVRYIMRHLARSDVDDDESDLTDIPYGRIPARLLDECIHHFGFGHEPLSTLARCLAIKGGGHSRHSHTVVVGTPLYVAFHPPR